MVSVNVRSPLTLAIDAYLFISQLPISLWQGGRRPFDLIMIHKTRCQARLSRRRDHTKHNRKHKTARQSQHFLPMRCNVTLNLIHESGTLHELSRTLH